LEILNCLNVHKTLFIEEWKSYQEVELETANFQRLKNMNDWTTKC
jgi:hypothetical protein